MLRRPPHVTRRRVAAHACPDCRRLWALRGVRTDTGAWLIVCTSCGWTDLRSVPSARTEVADRPGGAEPVGTTDGTGTAGDASGDGPATGSHEVLLYGTDEQLVDVLERYLATGWSQDAVGLVIATPEHRAALRSRLAGGAANRPAGDGLVELDAAQTLGQFMRDGVPDPERFDRTVGSLVRDHAADRPLRGFGEMVDVLWAEGNPAGALALESLWTGLQAQVRFSLLCAYAAAHVDPADRDAVVGAHEHQLT